MEGWIKIHRSLLDWEWYSDTNCVRLCLHFLLKANYQSKKWKGITVGRGQLVTSRGQLSEETGLSEMQIRTALDKLDNCGFITKSGTRKYTIITVCNYDSYQQGQDGYDNGYQPTDNQQITNNQPTDNQQITTTKEYKKERIEEYTHTLVDTKKGVVGGKCRRVSAVDTRECSDYRLNAGAYYGSECRVDATQIFGRRYSEVDRHDAQQRGLHDQQERLRHVRDLR